MRALLLAVPVLCMALIVTGHSKRGSKGLVSFTFDDGYRSGYKVASILEEAGYRGTYYVISQTLHQEFPGYMKAAEVKNLHSRGHEVGAHTRHHLDLIVVSAIEAEQEIVESREDLRAIGVETQSFAYPFGRHYRHARGLVERAGFGNAVSTDRGLNDSTTDRFALRRMPIDRVTSVDQVKGWIDTAVSQDKWLILEHHEIDSSNRPLSGSTSNFQEVVNYIKRKNIPVVTVSEGVAQISGLRAGRTRRSGGLVSREWAVASTPAIAPQVTGTVTIFALSVSAICSED
jgi:peptidoglycan/xylan/chitin deacetylase (PgdA/CDA1 family)